MGDASNSPRLVGHFPDLSARTTSFDTVIIVIGVMLHRNIPMVFRFKDA